MKKDKLEDDYLTSLSYCIESFNQQNYILTTWIYKEIFGISDADIEMEKKIKIAKKRFISLEE